MLKKNAGGQNPNKRCYHNGIEVEPTKVTHERYEDLGGLEWGGFKIMGRNVTVGFNQEKDVVITTPPGIEPPQIYCEMQEMGAHAFIPDTH